MNFIVKVLKPTLHNISNLSSWYSIYEGDFEVFEIWPNLKYLGFTKTNPNSLKKYLTKIKLRG